MVSSLTMGNQKFVDEFDHLIRFPSGSCNMAIVVVFSLFTSKLLNELFARWNIFTILRSDVGGDNRSVNIRVHTISSSPWHYIPYWDVAPSQLAYFSSLWNVFLKDLFIYALFILVLSTKFDSLRRKFNFLIVINSNTLFHFIHSLNLISLNLI